MELPAKIIEAAAAAIITARGAQRGMPPIENVLERVQRSAGPQMYRQIMECAEAALKAAGVGELLEACKLALSHVQEFRDAWERGAIRESDYGLGSKWSNQSLDVEVKLREAIANSEGSAK